MRITSVILLLCLVFSCKKKDEIRIDISENAKLWVPQNQDSVVFKMENSRDDVFVKYQSYQAKYLAGLPENYFYEVVSSEFKNYENTFRVSFKVSTDKPTYNPQGKLVKAQEFVIQNTLQQSFFIRFLNDSITTDLEYLPEAKWLNTTYSNVFTDNNTFYYTPSNGIVRFFDGNHWYNLINK